MKNIKPIKMIDTLDFDPSKQIKKNEEVALTTNHLPIEDLPSKYKLYPEGTKILARPLNVLEVKLLASMNNNNYNFVMNDILKKTVKGINVEDILIEDKHFIIFWLRANTYRNSGYEVDFVCEACEKTAKYHFDVNVLDIEYLKDDFDPNKEIILPNSKDVLTIKLKTISDETKLLEFIKRSADGLSKYDKELLNISYSIQSVNGETLSLLSKYQYLTEKMNPEDFSYFVSYLDLIVFGVKPEVKVSCNFCKEERPIGVTFRSEFFLPKCKF